jgi:hypothetical protein
VIASDGEVRGSAEVGARCTSWNPENRQGDHRSGEYAGLLPEIQGEKAESPLQGLTLGGWRLHREMYNEAWAGPMATGKENIGASSA